MLKWRENCSVMPILFSHVQKLDLEKTEEWEIKLPTSVGSSKKQESSRKTSTSLLTMPKPLTVWIRTNCWKIFQDGTIRPSDLPPEKSLWRWSNSQNWTSNKLVPNRKRSTAKLYMLSLCLFNLYVSSVQFSSVPLPCLTLCDPTNHSTPGLPVHQQLLGSTQIHVHWVGDAIQPSHPLLSLSPPALSLSQHEGLFTWVKSSHQVAKVLKFQLQHQSFQWIPRTDLL